MEISQYKHVKKIVIRYDDLDTLGHVNNKAYLSYLEEARIDYHKQLFSWKNELEFNAVVAKIEINYRKPLFYGNDLIIYTRLSNLGKKSFELESIFTIDDSKTGTPIKVADSKVVLVAINPANGQSIEIPDKERKILIDFEKQ